MTPIPSDKKESHLAEPASPMRLVVRGRSFMALVLAPQSPLTAWMTELDTQLERSGSFLSSKPIILDLGLLAPQTEGLANLQEALKARGILPIMIEGADKGHPSFAGWSWPQPMQGGRGDGEVSLVGADNPSLEEQEQAQSKAGTLFVEHTVRSGQSIVHLDGDLVVIGSLASGAELVASGSIHVLGTLRGRAIAGIGGNASARILAKSMQAELLAIDGFYMVAEDIPADVSALAAQAFLNDACIMVMALPKI